MKAVIVDFEKSEPRLLGLAAAAAHVGINRSALRQLVDTAQLSRVPLPGLRRPDVRLDRFLFGKADPDAVIESGKDRQEV